LTGTRVGVVNITAKKRSVSIEGCDRLRVIVVEPEGRTTTMSIQEE